MGTPEIVAAAMLVVVVLLYIRLADVEKRLATLSVMSAKLDMLIRHAGVEFDPLKHVPPDVLAALESGRKIEAIRLYRAATGVGLKEAKEFVEEVQRQLDQL